MRRWACFLVLVLGVVPVVAGCELLGVPAIDEDFGTPLATYGSGRATLEIDGETIVLDQVSVGPHLYEDFGGDVYWFNDDGWGLRLTTFDGGGLMASNDIAIDRVQTTYWSAPGFGDCIVDVEAIDEERVEGSATCEGLRWVDQLRGGQMWSDGPRYVEGEPAFDATVTFEATAAKDRPASASPSAPPG